MNAIDVIVPCYKYGRYLAACTASILSEPIEHIRVLILDDESPDDTAQVARQLAQADSRITFHQHTRNQGHIATFNEGLDWAEADAMLLLSADDYLLPGALARAVGFLREHPEAGFVFGACRELRPDGSQHQPYNPFIQPGEGTRLVSSRDFMRISGPRNLVPTPTAVVRTALQKRVGHYRPELPHTADMEMWLRLAAHGPVGVIDSCQAVYRRHTANMSLAYDNARSCLPDFAQRQAALAFFFQHDGAALPDAAALQARLVDQLAREAISRASTAFNDGNLRACEELQGFARTLSPPVTRSLPWRKLQVKHAIGRAAWLRLQAVREQLPARPEAEANTPS